MRGAARPLADRGVSSGAAAAFGRRSSGVVGFARAPFAPGFAWAPLPAGFARPLAADFARPLVAGFARAPLAAVALAAEAVVDVGFARFGDEGVASARARVRSARDGDGPSAVGLAWER
ncbi:MAG: hypothetical protein KF901_20015 [Myxococcales bacterium]|nr:hypothetical protein [Myxococcales bacterium]